jgi:phenol 2-monooxygenase (NADPH)
MASFPFCGPRRFRLGRVTALASDPNAPVKRYTPPGAEVDSVIDLRAVFQQGHRALKREDLTAFLLPQKGRYDLCGYEKMFCAYLKDGRDIFSMRVVDRDRACIMIVRPDQYIADVLPLDAQDELAVCFDRILLRRS